MGSSARLDARRAVLMDRLMRAWEKTPSETLGVFLFKALGPMFSTMSDDELIQAVERYVLLEAPSKE
jgi:hypothetical protein